MSQRRKICANRSFGRRLLRHTTASLAFGAVVVAAASSGALAQSSEPVDSTKIILGSSGAGGISQIPVYVALQQDLFKKAGLNVENQQLNGGTPAAMAAFASGALSIVSLSAPELIPYVAHKAVSGKAFAEMVDQGYDVVVAKEITSFPELKGKTVGLSSPNSADYVFLVATLQHYGLSPSDVTFVTSGNPVNRLAAVAAGVVQLTAGLNAQRADEEKSGTILLKSGDNPVGFPQVMFIANNDLLNNHKSLLKTFVTVMQQATAWMKANPAEAAALCAKTINATVEVCGPAIALNFDKSVSSKFTWSATYGVNVDGVKSALAVMATLDPTTKDLTVDDIADTSVAGTTP